MNGRINGLVAKNKQCGRTTCNATWRVGIGGDIRTGSSGSASATYNGEECTSGGNAQTKCCVPVQYERINAAWNLGPSQPGPSTADHFWTYAGNANLDAVFQHSLGLENALNGATWLIVEYMLFEGNNSTSPMTQIPTSGYVFYTATSLGSFGPWGAFSQPQYALKNGKYYELRLKLRFWRRGGFFEKDCEYKGLFYDRTSGQKSLRSVSNEAVIGVIGSKQVFAKPLKTTKPTETGDVALPNDLPKEIAELIKSSAVGGDGNTAEPNVKWTEWLNLDLPGGDGDFQTIAMVKDRTQISCDAPAVIQCRRVSDKKPADQTRETLTCDTQTGFSCRNKQQSDRKCDDYEIRLLCPQ